MVNTQRFHKGDFVRVAKDLGSTMSHFPADCEAIVLGSYNDQYGGGNTDSYTLYLKSGGSCSWYHERQLTLIETGRLDKLQEWEEAAEVKRKKAADLDWIFSNGEDVLSKPQSASIEALAACFGLNDLWGSHGEGMTWYSNANFTLSQAKPFLTAGDKAGWLAHAADLAAQNVAAALPDYRVS